MLSIHNITQQHLGLLNGNLHPFLLGLVISKELSFFAIHKHIVFLPELYTFSPLTQNSNWHFTSFFSEIEGLDQVTMTCSVNYLLVSL